MKMQVHNSLPITTGIVVTPITVLRGIVVVTEICMILFSCDLAGVVFSIEMTPIDQLDTEQ